MSRQPHAEDGFTLVELVISVVILGMIMGGLAASFITAFDIQRPTAERVRQSNSAQVIASFLVRDAQAAGGTNPTTVSAYTGLSGFPSSPLPVPVPGVFLPPLNSNIGSYCAATGVAVAQFDWNDRASNATSHGHVVVYSLSSNSLIRTSCVDGGPPSTNSMGSDITSATAAASCNLASCPAGLPTSVTLHVVSVTPSTGPAYTYDLTASLRPDNNQAIPTNANASPAPLLTLGGVGCDAQGTTSFDVGGTPSVTIYGQVAINAQDSPGCPAMYLHGAYDYSSGAISVLNGGTCSGCPSYTSYSTPFTDPFASTLQPLSAACSAGGSNPVPGGSGFQPGAQPLVFPNVLNVGNTFFAAGTYVFCHGLTAGTITTPTPPAPGVVFYIVSGGLTQAGGSDTTINGLVYAPTSIIDISGNGHFRATTVVAGAVNVQGNAPVVVIGTPPAVNISITAPLTLPSWDRATPYPNTTMTANGGGGIYSWTQTGLPAGLSLNAVTGVISGTPTTTGSSPVQVTVTDSLGDTASKSYTVNINAAPTITGPASLTDWTISRDYPGTAIIASGGTTPYAWSAINLPTGLSINSSTGVVSGTPGATGTFTPTVTLTDATGAAATRSYTIKINANPSITGPNTLPNWTTGQAGYSQTATATNGTLAYIWAASGLPTNLAINSSTGVISGTPNSPGTYSVSVTVTDLAGASATRNYTVTINPVPGIATALLPTAEVNRPYNFTLTPTAGGTPPFTWSLPTHPAWLTINASTGALSGTPTATGTYNVTAKFTDATGASAQRTYSLTIAAAVQISGPATLPNWTINRDYPGTAIIGTGGVTPFTWSATGLPAGLSINSGTGVISGTPSATGTASIVVTVVDAAGGSDTQSYTVTINAVPTISTTTLPSGEQSVAYSATLSAANGTAPYSWAASGLPGGLLLNASTGVLSGTPTVAGTFSVTISATDTAGASASKIFSLVLSTGPSASGTLPNWTVNRAYPNSQITGSGGTAPYTYTATNLPAGLSIGLNTGLVTGTPTATGTKAVTITVRDSLGATSVQNLSVTINAAPTITTASPLPTGAVGTPYTTTIATSNGTTPFTWTATGLPGGLTINAATGVISGTPTVAGTFAAVVVSLTDAAGATATHAAYSMTITGPLPTVSTINPPSQARGGAAFTVTITGTNFVSGAVVSVSGSRITVGGTTFVSSTSLTVSITLAGNSQQTARDVTVTNPDGGFVTITGGFTVT